MLNGLDLFSGIGGLSKALSPWVRTVAYCENDSYAQAVLLSRMACGDLRSAPIWDDVRTLQGSDVGVPAEVIFGGFPCQDVSSTGPKHGLGGERSGLFFEAMRLVGELRPSFVFIENVTGLAFRGLDRCIEALASRGYVGRIIPLGAGHVGAWHPRNRIWICAWRKDVADGARIGWEQGRPGGTSREWESEDRLTSRWATEPDVDRVVYGLPQRVDRLRGLGNAVVPLQAREAFKRLIGL